MDEKELDILAFKLNMDAYITIERDFNDEGQQELLDSIKTWDRKQLTIKTKSRTYVEDIRVHGVIDLPDGSGTTIFYKYLPKENNND